MDKEARDRGREIGRERLTYVRHARQYMHIPVHNRDGDPVVVEHEDSLLRQVPRLVGRQLDHANAGLPRRRFHFPAEVGLRPVLAEPLHELEGIRVHL